LVAGTIENLNVNNKNAGSNNYFFTTTICKKVLKNRKYFANIENRNADKPTNLSKIIFGFPRFGFHDLQNIFRFSKTFLFLKATKNIFVIFLNFR
jgi:hypothetical protein